MYLSRPHIEQIGFKSVGEGVRISSLASFYGAANISLDDYCRIDDYVVISSGEGGIKIGKHVHIGCYTSLIGQGKITLHNYVELSGRVSVYSSSNDYNAPIYYDKTGKRINILFDDVVIGSHVVVGCGSVILPGVILGEGVRIAAMSLVKDHIHHKQLWGGVPAKKIKDL